MNVNYCLSLLFAMVAALCCQGQALEQKTRMPGTKCSASGKVTIQIDSATAKMALEKLFENGNCYIDTLVYKLKKKASFNLRDTPFLKACRIIEKAFQIDIILETEMKSMTEVKLKIPWTVTGIVYSSRYQPLANANITIKSKTTAATTDQSGRFTMAAVQYDSLLISHAAYETVTISVDTLSLGAIFLKDRKDMEALVFVDDGLHPRDRRYTTGAFVIIPYEQTQDNPAIDLVNKIDGNAVNFGTKQSSVLGTQQQAPRGTNSLLDNGTLPFMVNGFLAQVNMAHYNTDDIERVTYVLDPGAAAIHGGYASNGVGVISMKNWKAKNSKAIDFRTRTNFTEEPDISYRPPLSAPETIALERDLFNTVDQPAANTLSMVQNLLYRFSKGGITSTELQDTLAILAKNNLPRQERRYLHRKGSHIHQSLSIMGDTAHLNYYASFSWDKDQLSMAKDNIDRYTMYGRITRKIGTFSIEASTYLSALQTTTNTHKLPNRLTYTALADKDQNPLPMLYGAAPSLSNTASPGTGMDTRYIPLDEMKYHTNTTGQQLRQCFLKLSKAFVDSIFFAELYWQGTWASYSNKEAYTTRSWYYRYLANLYWQPGQTPIPKGTIIDAYTITNAMQNLRAQWITKLTRKWFRLDAYLGAEARLNNARLGADRTYGVQLGQMPVNIDYNKYYVLNDGSGSATIPKIGQNRDSVDNYMSYYANGIITLFDRLNLSGNIRKDFTNHFAKESNNWKDPLWSIGAAWNLGAINMRTSYGWMGNSNYAQAPFPTISDQGFNNGPVASLDQLPAKDLGYERVRMWNLGLDIIAGKKLTANIDYYRKLATDLVIDAPDNPTTGSAFRKANAGSLKGWGIEAYYSLKNSYIGKQWKIKMDGLFGFNTHRLIKGPEQAKQAWQMMYAGYYMTNRPLDAVYAFAFQGLSHDKGAPQGYYKGSASTDYQSIWQDANLADLVYKGRTNPAYYASTTPAIVYGPFSLSGMFLLKAGYVFRKKTMHYWNFYYLQDNGTVDFPHRWKKAGDEDHTSIPAVPARLDKYQDDFYQYSTRNVLPADHLRLKWVRLAYEKPEKAGSPKTIRSWYASITIFNVGILWRANKENIDPEADANGYPPMKSISLSLNFRF